MVNLKPPVAPVMTEIGGRLYRPEDVEAAEKRQAALAEHPAGSVDPTPIGVPRATENRRRTLSELSAEAGETAVDPAATVLARVEASDVGSPLDVDDDPAAVDGSKAKASRKRGAADAGE